MKEKIEAIVAEFKRLQAEFQERAQAAIKEAFTEFFERNPGVTAIRWTQYTPYFNDGEECIFSKHEFYYTTSSSPEGKTDWDEEKTDWRYPSPYNREKRPEDTAVAEFDEIVSVIPDDVWKTTFGDHVEVTATREAFDVEEYEHD